MNKTKMSALELVYTGVCGVRQMMDNKHNHKLSSIFGGVRRIRKHEVKRNGRCVVRQCGLNSLDWPD